MAYKGARVRHSTTEELSETYPVRASIEELAGTLAAARVDGVLLESLEGELDAMRVCARSGNLHQQLSHDARVHELIVEAAGNRVLLEAWRALRIEARTLVSVIKSGSDLLEIADTHQVIVDALRTGDPKLVAKELRRRIEMFWCAPVPAMILPQFKRRKGHRCQARGAIRPRRPGRR